MLNYNFEFFNLFFFKNFMFKFIQKGLWERKMKIVNLKFYFYMNHNVKCNNYSILLNMKNFNGFWIKFEFFNI
jgi:hypothetical protein